MLFGAIGVCPWSIVTFIHPLCGLRLTDKTQQEEDNHSGVLADNVNERLSKALRELAVRHARGRGERDDPDRAPTGSAYYQYRTTTTTAAGAAALQQQPQPAAVTPNGATGLTFGGRGSSPLGQNSKNEKEDEDDEDEDDYDWLLDDAELGADPDEDLILEALRERRLRELQASATQKAADLARGHGQVRTITQDEFLPECTGTSSVVVCHFFHREFQRCQILDHHLKVIAPLHTECKFIRIDAEKAPFFVGRLQIRTLPTLLVLRDGRVVDRLVGFEGLAAAAAVNQRGQQQCHDPDDWETSALQGWLAKAGAIQYKEHADREEPEIRRQRLRGCLRRGDCDQNDDDHY